MSGDALPTPSIVLHFPVPPSANRIWRFVPNMRRPILSDEYRKWRTTAGWECRRQLVGVPTITGRFIAHIAVPQRLRRDLDNSNKPILDLAQAVGAVRNDKGCIHLTVIPADRDDVLLLLWDRGGEVPGPARRKAYRPATQPRNKATPSQLRAFRRAGGLA